MRKSFPSLTRTGKADHAKDGSYGKDTGCAGDWSNLFGDTADQCDCETPKKNGANPSCGGQPPHGGFFDIQQLFCLPSTLCTLTSSNPCQENAIRLSSSSGCLKRELSAVYRKTRAHAVHWRSNGMLVNPGQRPLTKAQAQLKPHHPAATYSSLREQSSRSHNGVQPNERRRSALVEISTRSLGLKHPHRAHAHAPGVGWLGRGHPTTAAAEDPA